MNLLNDLKWRGLIHTITPGVEKELDKNSTIYIGFDPTGESLHVGHLVSIITLKRFQDAGHKVIALIGGATGMIGDPSGKLEERNLLSEEAVANNTNLITKQIQKIIPDVEILNNKDWFNNITLMTFLREIGKLASVNNMLSKDSVQRRLEHGISFTEFTYQLMQGADFLHLYTNKKCTIQLGGSDQWGNMVSGIDLIRRKTNNNAFAITFPLLTKSDGTKFGKTESGSVRLDLSPFAFMQFWLNISDDDAIKLIKFMTFIGKDDIENLISEHKKIPHERILQKIIAKELVIMLYSKEEFKAASNMGNILFGKSSNQDLKTIPTHILPSIFNSLTNATYKYNEIESGVNVVDFLIHTQLFNSKSECRRLIKNKGLLINKNQITDSDFKITIKDLLQDEFILVQTGKKNFSIIKIIK